MHTTTVAIALYISTVKTEVRMPPKLLDNFGVPCGCAHLFIFTVKEVQLHTNDYSTSFSDILEY